MDKCIERLGEATIFAMLEANWSSWQIPVAPNDRDNTTFLCHSGLHRFKRISFGLTNTLVTFYRVIDIIRSQHKYKTCLVYLNDIIIISNAVEEHFAHFKQILKRI